MPKYPYETYSNLKSTSNNSTTNKERAVGYFKLKPNEKAVVRFAYASPSELEVVTIHEVRVKDKFRTIVCLRTANEPIDNCPLCANGSSLKARVYVKLLRYVLDETGKVVKVSPEVANWPKKYADVLMARYNEYGDLKDNLFTITRVGSGMETSYEIQYANPVKYSEANGFVKDFSAFDNFDLSGHSYTEKTKEEIEEFLQTGDFPYKKHVNNESKNLESLELSVEEEQAVLGKAPVSQETIVERPVAPQQPQQQTSSDDFTFARPRRTYDIQ